jgi:hypothetical protein
MTENDQLPAEIVPANRLLTSAEFHQLAAVPPEIEGLTQPLLFTGIAGIRWRMSHNAMTSFTELGVETKQFTLSCELHPPCLTIASCGSISQPFDARKSSLRLMVGG